MMLKNEGIIVEDPKYPADYEFLVKNYALPSIFIYKAKE